VADTWKRENGTDDWLRENNVDTWDRETIAPTLLHLRNTQTNGISIGGVACYDLLTTLGSAPDTAVVNATASGTDIQFTKTAGGSALWFITGRVPSGGWTIENSDIALWLFSSAATVNAGGRYRLHKWSAGTLTLITGSPFDDGVEIDTVEALYEWAGNVTDTALAENDRLVLELDITNVGTMASGTVTLMFNGDGLAGIVEESGPEYSNYDETSNHTTNTVAITVTDADYLAIAIHGGNSGGTDVPDISSITVNGSSTGVNAVSGATSGQLNFGDRARNFGYELVGPTAGSYNVVVTFSATIDLSKVTVQGYKNVNPASPSEGGNSTGVQTSAAGNKNVAPTTGTVAGDMLYGGGIFPGSDGSASCVDIPISYSYYANNGWALIVGADASTGTGENLTFANDQFQGWAAFVWAIKNKPPSRDSYLNVYPSVTFKPEGGGTDVDPAEGDLTFTGYAPAVTQSVNRFVNPAEGDLTFTGYAPAVTQSDNRFVNPTEGDFTFTGYAPTITQSVNVNPTEGDFTFTGYAPVVTQSDNRFVAPAEGDLTFTGYAPIVKQLININPDEGDLTFTGYAPTITQSVNVNPIQGDLDFTGYAPVVTQSDNRFVAPAEGDFTFTGYAPSVVQSDNRFVNPTEGDFTFTGYAPTVDRTANQEVVPAEGDFTFTGYAPIVSQTNSLDIVPGVGTFIFTGYAPTVDRTANQEVAPAQGDLEFTGHAPSVTQSDNNTVAPAQGDLEFTGYAPIVSQSLNRFVNPADGDLVFTGYAPIVTQAPARIVNNPIIVKVQPNPLNVVYTNDEFVARISNAGFIVEI
jgi:hypothetical protein